MRSVRRLIPAALILVVVVATTGVTQTATAAPPTVPLIGVSSNIFDSTSTPVDLPSFSTGPDIPLDGAPIDSVFSPDGSTAYFGDPFGTRITVLNMDDLSTSSFDVGFSPAALAITSDGSTLYGSDYSTTNVYPIDLATETVGAPITAGANTFHMRWAPDGTTLWVPSYPLNELKAIDTTTNTVTQTISIPSAFDIAISNDGTWAYVSQILNGSVVRVDLVAETLGTPFPAGDQPAGMVMTEDESTLYMADAVGNVLVPIDVATETLGTPLPTGSGSVDVDLTSDGATAYVTAANDFAVSEVDLATFTVTNSISTGDTPYSFTIFEGEPSPCTITGTSGNDNITGTAGNDYICGMGGRDVIRGLGGDDTLLGADGADKLFPGLGDDTVDGGNGVDWVDYSDVTTTGVVASLSAGTSTGAGTDSLAALERLRGTKKSDTLTGDNTDNTVIGLQGDDTIYGFEGIDTVKGGYGTDELWSQDGIDGDTVDGGKGPTGSIDVCNVDPLDIVTNCEAV